MPYSKNLIISQKPSSLTSNVSGELFDSYLTGKLLDKKLPHYAGDSKYIKKKIQNIARKMVGKPQKINLYKNVKGLGLAGIGVGVLLDAFQGRDNANKIYKDPTIGQRAAAVGSSIYDGFTLGLSNADSLENVDQVYNYWKEKADAVKKNLKYIKSI